MNYKQFIIELQKYYGVYENEFVRKEVYDYVRQNYYECELVQLLQNIKRHFSREWKIRPDIAVVIETEKTYPVISWGAGGDRVIPSGAKKRSKLIEEAEEDFSQEIHEMWKEMKEAMDERMKQVRKEGNDK
jgi:hypothetical protein